MCHVAPSHMKVSVRSSWDQECWPILVCVQVLFVYHGYQHDFALGWSLLLGNVSTEDKLDPSSVKNYYFSRLAQGFIFFLYFLFCTFLPRRKDFLSI